MRTAVYSSAGAFLAAVCFVLAASELDAAVVEIEVVPPLEGSAVGGTLEAQSVSNESGTARVELRSFKVIAPGKVRLPLDLSRVWELRPSFSGYWSPKILVGGPSGVQGGYRINLFRTAEVHGRFRTVGASDPAEHLSVRFEPYPPVAERAPASSAPGSGKVDCKLGGLAWSCEVPAGRFDLRLRAKGFVSHFLWDRSLSPGQSLDVGELELRAGASLTGWVETAPGTGPLKACKVLLEPLASAPSPPDSKQRSRRLSLETTPSDRGFFHFDDIPAGSYRLVARQPGMSPAKLFPVEVRERTETEVRVPLVLAPPVSLSVVVEPPVDPLEEPWSLKVWQLSDIPGGMEEVKAEKETHEGRHTYSELPSGSYLVQVLDSRSNVLATKELALDTEPAELAIELPLVWVEGEVRLGGEPIAADLLFGGRHAEQRMRLAANEDGEFLGYLPREGRWEVLVQGRLPEFETTVPGVEVKERRGFGSARVEIRLPGTKVTGVVVDGRGNAVGGALVRAAEDSPVTFQQTQADAEGRFRFRGLGEGLVDFRAESPRGSSPSVKADLSEDDPPPELRLVVGDYREISAQVVGPNGPVPSAAVAATPLGPGGARLLVGVPDQISDVEGKVRVLVPREAEGLELLVLAPGHALGVVTLTGLERYLAGTLPLRVQDLSGTIRLEAPGASEFFGLSEPFPILLVDGHVVGAYSLARWSEINGVRNPDFRSMTLPAMPVGLYTACLLAAESARQLANPQVPESRCASGFLPANGELELTIP